MRSGNEVSRKNGPVTAETPKLRRPCSNCPWRVDAPREYWDPQHFADIWQSCQDDGHTVMLCHKANALPPTERDKMPCQGWIRVLGFDAIGVRLLAWQGHVSFEEVEDKEGPTLFETFAKMLQANNVPPPSRSRVLSTPRRVRGRR